MDFSGIMDRGLTLIDGIKLATFPEIAHKGSKVSSIWFDGYLSTMLQHDVKQIAELEKISVLPQLLQILSVRTGGLLNDSDISREIGLTSVTTKFYRHILKMMLSPDIEISENVWSNHQRDI